MVHHCCVPNCHSMGTTSPNDCNISFFIFPNKQLPQYNEWIGQCQKAESLNKRRMTYWSTPEKPVDNGTKEICSRHFAAKYFRIDQSGRKLFNRDGSMPSIFPIVIGPNKIQWKDISSEVVDFPEGAHSEETSFETVFLTTLCQNPEAVEITRFNEDIEVILDSDDDDYADEQPNTGGSARVLQPLVQHTTSNEPDTFEDVEEDISEEMFQIIYDTEDIVDDAGNTVIDTDDDSIVFVGEEMGTVTSRRAQTFQKQPQKRPPISTGAMESSARVITAPIVHTTDNTITFASTTTSGQQIYITQFRNRKNVIDSETLKIINPAADAQQPTAQQPQPSRIVQPAIKTISAKAAAAASTSGGKRFKSFNEIMSSKQIVPGSADEVAAIRFCERFLKQQNLTIANLERSIEDIGNKTVVLRAQIKSTNAALTELESD